MQKKRRNGRASTKTSVEDEIAHLRGLDLGGLRARWQSVFQRQASAHGPVARLVGIKGGVVSGVFNLESSSVEALDWRPRHDEQYDEA